MSLSVEQKIELSHLEKTIAQGKQASIEMALALLEIREQKLYRDNYASFEEYCAQRWEFSDRYGRMLVEYGQTVREIQARGGTVVPGNERQSRELKGLEPEQKVRALECAAVIAPDHKPTVQHVAKAARAVRQNRAYFEPGTVAIVQDETSRYHGQQVEIVGNEGVIVMARTPGREITPFLSSELSTDDTPSPEPRQAKPPKPNHFENLEIANQILHQRCEILERELERAIGFLRESKSPDVQQWIEQVGKLLN